MSNILMKTITARVQTLFKKPKTTKLFKSFREKPNRRRVKKAYEVKIYHLSFFFFFSWLEDISPSGLSYITEEGTFQKEDEKKKKKDPSLKPSP